MDVELDPKTRKDLEDLARAEGKEPGTLLGELVREAIATRKHDGDVCHEPEVIHGQQEALEELHRTVDALPAEGPQNGFSARDHDSVLYGKSP